MEENKESEGRGKETREEVTKGNVDREGEEGKNGKGGGKEYAVLTIGVHNLQHGDCMDTTSSSWNESKEKRRGGE